MTLSPLPPRADLLSSRLYQAALTYTQRWLFWVNGILLLLMLTLIGCLFPFHSDDFRPIFGSIAILQLGGIGLSVTLHLKEQLDDWRSWLTPGFRLPHIAIAAIVVTSICLGISPLIAIPIRVDPLPLCAAALALSAASGWLIYDPLILLLLGVISATLIATCVKINAEEFIENLFVAFPLTIALGSATLIALLWTCLCRLNGGEGARQNTISASFEAAIPSNSAPTSIGPITSAAGQVMLWISNVVQTSSGNRLNLKISPLQGAWAHSLHRRRTSADGGRVWAFGGMSSLLIVVILGVLKHFPGYEVPRADAGALMLGTCPLMLPIILAGILWPRRWSYLAQESLLPASRQSFVYETGVALAVDLGILWLSSVVVSLVGAALLFPDQFRMYGRHIASLVTLSAATEPCVFALVISAMLLRNVWVSLGIMLVLICGSLVIIPWEAREGPGLVAVVLWTGALTTASLLITFAAYRRWCQTPFG